MKNKLDISNICYFSHIVIYEKYYQYIIPILNQLKNSYAVIKGEVLSFQAYGKPGMRYSKDIDVLVSRGSLSELENVLYKNGFESTNKKRSDRILMLSSSHQVSPWIKNYPPFGIINIDLNFDIFWGEYTGKRINIDDFLSDSIEIEIYNVRVNALSKLKAMVQLILHHYKEMNSIYHLASHNCINYNMFKDVYYLWKNNQDDVSIDKLYDISVKYEIVPYVFYVLYFTNRIYEDLKLRDYVHAFETEEGLNLLNLYGLSDNERKMWRFDFQTRLEANNLFDLIKYDLTVEDFEKLERNRSIFG